MKKTNDFEIQHLKENLQKSEAESDALRQQVSTLESTLYQERHLFLEDKETAKRLTGENEALQGEIQPLKAQIDSLEAKVESLEAQTKTLEAQVESVEAQAKVQQDGFAAQLQEKDETLAEKEEQLKQLQLNYAVLVGRFKQSEEHNLSLKEQKKLITAKYQKLLEDQNKRGLANKIRNILGK